MYQTSINPKDKNKFSIPIVVRATNRYEQNIILFRSTQIPYNTTPEQLTNEIIELVKLWRKCGEKVLPVFYREKHFHKDSPLTEYDKYDYVAVVKIKPTFAEWTILSFDYNK